MHGIIYKATNQLTGKSYIGQTNQSIQTRKTEHKYNAKNNIYCSYFHRSIRKYGWDNFQWEVLCECASREEMNEKEMYYIKELDTFGSNGYNLTFGGDGQNGSQWWLGKKHTEESKKKMRESGKNKKLSEEHKRKISLNHRHHQTEETKQKISKNNAMNNPDYRLKAVRNRQKLHYIVTSPLGEVYNVFSLKPFCEKMNLNRCGLGRVARGAKNNYKGWICEYSIL